MDHATFTAPDLTTFSRLDDLGLQVTGQHLSPERATFACRPVELDDWCHRYGCHGRPGDSVVRQLAHVPFGWRPAILQVRLRRYQCGECDHVWRHTRRCNKYVTVVIDLTPVSTGTGPSRLLAMVEGRSKQAFKTWLSEHPRPGVTG